jgi:CRP-like cAMP-binding protein
LLHDLEPLLRGHEFFAGLDPAYLALIAGCAKNVAFKEGEFLFREGEPASAFFMIRAGRVGLEIAAPGQEPVRVQTLSAGDVAGFSWLIDTHIWRKPHPRWLGRLADCRCATAPRRRRIRRTSPRLRAGLARPHAP